MREGHWREGDTHNAHHLCRVSRVFLNPWFGEPMVCTTDSRGFRHFRGFRDFRESSTQVLVCSCQSCLRRFRRFRDFRRFRERRPARKTIGLPNHRFRNTRVSYMSEVLRFLRM